MLRAKNHQDAHILLLLRGESPDVLHVRY